MKSWVPLRDMYLDELVRREGRGDFVFEHCSACPKDVSQKAVYRCLDCSPGPLCCKTCLRDRHALLPYHRIQVCAVHADVGLASTDTRKQRWTGQCFEASSLVDAGLRIQLGHCDGSSCASPIPARQDFCAIDVNGRHNLALSFCGCDQAAQAGDFVQQLLRFDLYPATNVEPNTAFTFQLLEHYHIQSLQGKISMFDYCTISINSDSHASPAPGLAEISGRVTRHRRLV